MASPPNSTNLSSSPLSPLGSRVVNFAELPVITTPKGLRRDVFEGTTATLTHFECHITTLNPGEAPHEAHRHPDEELILVKEGTLEVAINGQTSQAGPGSVFFFSAQDLHGLRNGGATQATYHVFRFSTPLTASS
jgi:XRE family transcriptional regulator, regulator of sulfur utilization